MDEKEKSVIRDFTSGKIMPAMIAFAVPFMLSNALQVFYSLVDMIVVGRYIGSAGLSAVSLSSQMVNVATMLCMGFATGGQVTISQIVGSGEREKLSPMIGTLVTFIGFLGLIMTIVGIVFRNWFLVMLDTPAESFAMAQDYLLVCACGILFTYGYNLLSGIFRGLGDSRHPFIFIVIASMMNLLLDLLFVAVFGWGVFGAALATVIGQACSVIFAIVFLGRHKERMGFEFHVRDLTINPQILKVLVKLGVPFACQACTVNISMLFVNKLVNGAGVYAAATFGVGVKLDDIVNKITQGLLFATSSMVGQNIAAREQKRALHVVYSCWFLAAVCYGLFTIVYVTNREFLFGLFTSDPKVIELSAVFLSAIIWTFPGMALMRGSSGFIQGVGFANFSLILALIDGVILRIGLSYLFGVVMNMGLYGYFLGYALAPYGSAIPGIIYMISGKWKTRKLLMEQ